MHIVSTSTNGNRNNSKNECYIEMKFFGYKVFQYRFDDKPEDAKTENTSTALQRLNHAISMCLMLVFSIAIIILAFAVKQVFLVQEKNLEIINLQQNITKLQQQLLKSEELVIKLQQQLLKSEEHERFFMFKIHLANTSNVLTEQDLKTLARKTDGYSEDDISNIVRDSLMQRVRMVQTATHFKKVRGPSPLDNTKIVDDLITPCSPSDAGAFKMTEKDIPMGKLIQPSVTMGDMLKSLANTKPNVGDADLTN